MTETLRGDHNHVFLGEGHDTNERRTWTVIGLCSFMMVAEIAGGMLFGSIALVADGLHMSTHASALLLAALAYRYARLHVHDERFSFGTGKLGDLAGFSSAIVLAMIALLIGYESASRLIWPVAINFNEAIPIAALGLVVNVASVLLLSGAGHRHGHNHSHSHANADHHHHDQARSLQTAAGRLTLEIFERSIAPRFRVSCADKALAADEIVIETVRPGGERQVFALAQCDGCLESVAEIPEPHVFTARIAFVRDPDAYTLEFLEHEHANTRTRGALGRDHNMRAAIVHVLADGAVSLLVIVGLLLARFLGWTWMDPVVGLCGAVVIAAWSYSLIRDTGAILLDMNPDRSMAARMRAAIEQDGDRLTDLHLWRLGPGHLAAIIEVATEHRRGPDYYQSLLRGFPALSHVTVQVQHPF